MQAGETKLRAEKEAKTDATNTHTVEEPRYGTEDLSEEQKSPERSFESALEYTCVH
jgi:hypothetical protein